MSCIYPSIAIATLPLYPFVVVGGIIALPILAIQAIYQKVMLNNAYEKSKKNGNDALSDDLEDGKPRYMNLNYEFQQDDLPRLQAEQERILWAENLDTTLNCIKSFAQAFIPIIGLTWMLSTGKCCGCDFNSYSQNLDKIITPDKAINHHIQKLQS